MSPKPSLTVTNPHESSEDKRSTRNKVSGNGTSSSGVQGEMIGTNLAKVFGKAYGDQYLKRFQRPYEFKKKDYVACAELVKLAPLQELAALIDKCWDSQNAFYRNCASDLMLFRQKFNALVAAFAQPTAPLRPPSPQPAYQRDWTDEEFINPPDPSPERVCQRPPGQDPYAQ